MTAYRDATALVGDAASLIAFSMSPKIRPSRERRYGELIRRYDEDPEFEAAVKALADGLGLRVVGVTAKAGGVVVGLPTSVFETKLENYARAIRRENQRDSERVLHGIAHLAIAATAFPRPDDLANDMYVGRVSVTRVDNLVRQVCRELEERSVEVGENQDPPIDAPELESAWRVYRRRFEDGATRDGRAAPPSTTAIISRALKYLADYGMLQSAGVDGEDSEDVYRTTARYQLQVRELAAIDLFKQLSRLGADVPVRPGPSLQVAGENSLY